MPSPSHLKTDKNSPEPKQGEIQFPEARSARDKQSKPDKTILIIGGGFAGLNVAKGLVGTNAKVLMIDRTNHHLFQPLLYQVATATLSPRDVAAPLRSILQKNPNLQVIMGSVCEFNPINKKVRLSDDTEFTYDYLVIAIGSRHSYFGHPEWEKIAPGLKTIQDAVRIREKILTSLEAAERISDKIEQRKCLTYVIIGGGPTGVEMAGAIAEIVKKSIRGEFRNFSISETRVILIEGSPRVLGPYPESLSEAARKNLIEMGVEVRVNATVSEVSEDGVKIGDEWIPTRTVVWAAGNVASPILKTLGGETDRMGRVVVNQHLNLPNHDDVYVIGDCACFTDPKSGKPLPGIAPVAMQQGHYIGRLLRRRLIGKPTEPFQYLDKGTMATIGHGRAVASVFGLKFKGFIAWMLWSLIHIAYLIGFRNKVVVMLEWLWTFNSSKRSVRLIAHSKETKDC